MPEGPEIHRAAARIHKALAGKPLESVEFAFEQLKPWERRLRGREVLGVDAHGKAMLTRFEGGVNLYSHNQLYGKWYVQRTGKLPRTNRSLRVGLHNDTHSALLYSASDVAILQDPELATHPFLSKLGPEVLDPGVSWQDVAARLREPRFRRRRLTALLLDQGCLSGLGNYLRSEILFVARIAPDRRPCDLDVDELEDLARAVLTISRRSLRHAGVTNDLDHVRELKAEGWPRWRYRHFVFGRDGEPCHQCAAPILRLEAGSRRLYVCPSCQRAPELLDG